MAEAAIEDEVRRRCAEGDVHGAATFAIQGLGPELLGFLIVLAGDHADAGDVFTDTCVRMWKGLPGFRWESSLRTWAYVLARRAFYAHRRSHAQWRDRKVRLSDVPDVDEMIVRMRTTTLARMRGEPQTRAEKLRAQLTPDEQVILTLRLDREMEWREMARVLDDEHDDPDDDTLTRAAAALRKKFERIKEKLRVAAAAME